METALATMKEMLEARGFSTDEEFEVSKSYIVKNESGDKLLVMSIADAKLGINNAKQIEIARNEYNVNHIVILHNKVVTPFAKTAINNIETETNSRIELFGTSELAFNITNHSLVPKHELMPLQFKKELLKFFKIHEKRLPIIKCTDPIAKFYGATAGDLFRITRIHEDGRCMPYFRIVT